MKNLTQTFLKWGLLGGIASATIGLILFMHLTEKMMKAPFFFLVSLFNTALLGLMISLLSSLILRKAKPEELIVKEKLSE